MLSEREKLLLTAYVDGELSSRKRKQAVRLLRKSGDARQLLRDLQADANSLANLPVSPLPRDLSGSVLEQIAQRKLRPRREEVLEPTSLAIPTWMGVAVAAVVLFVVGICSYFFFAVLPSHSGNSGPMVERPSKDDVVAQKDLDKDSKQRSPSPRRKDTSKDGGTVPSPKPAPENPEGPGPSVIVKDPTKPENPENPHPLKPTTPPSPVLADKPGEKYKLKTIEVVLPELFGVHELVREPARAALLDHLKQTNRYRVELPCRDGAKSLRALQTVLESHEINLILEPVAQKRLGKPTRKTSFLVYLDDVTPEKLTSILVDLGRHDKEVTERQPSARQFTQVVLAQASHLDRRELKEHTGRDLFERKSPSTGPLGTDIRKPLSEQTAEEIARALDGKNAPAAAKDKQGNFALTMVYNLVRLTSPSATIAEYEQRQLPREKGTLRVLLVLRDLN